MIFDLRYTIYAVCLNCGWIRKLKIGNRKLKVVLEGL